MQKYGALLCGLRYDAPNLPDANISCSLSELNTVVRLRLDRFEVIFSTFHEVGGKIAQDILREGWAALHEVDASIEVVEHRIALNIATQVPGPSYDAVMSRYVSAPTALGERSRAGVLFSLPEDVARGERQGSILLAHFTGQEQDLLLRVNLILDAKQVPFSDLPERIKEYLTRYLGHLGLVLDQEERR
jgi:hypothetical protein